MRTTPCTQETRRGRFRKAQEFREAAHLLRDVAEDATSLGDAYITLCVHAGIAAADVICCGRLAQHARGDNHQEAVGLLRTADPDAARHLATLLGFKTKAAYSEIASSRTDTARAERAMAALLEVAAPYG